LVWCVLMMHASQRPFSGVERDIALHEFGIQSFLFKFLLAPRTREKTALVLLSSRAISKTRLSLV
jgi:hypothetical protein